MKLYKVEIDSVGYFATSKEKIEKAKADLVSRHEHDDFTVTTLDIPISKLGILDALCEGADAAGGHEMGGSVVLD